MEKAILWIATWAVRSGLVHRWCRRIVRALGIGCTISGSLPSNRRLAVVSNHLSYLDIMLYSAAQPFIMVAKSEVRSWPLIGWLTAQAGTVYVQRADMKGGRTQTREEVDAAMAEAFCSGLPVLFFPEGTTSDGEEVLPFRRGLFHAVIRADVPLATAAISYALAPGRRMSVARHVCYWGEMSFGPHLFCCLGAKGLQGHLSFGDEKLRENNHLTLATEARKGVLRNYAALAPKREWTATHSDRALLRGARATFS